MPSRRSLLAGAAALAGTALGVAGTRALDRDDRFSPAVHTWLPQRPEGATVVGRAETTLGEQPYGELPASAFVYRLDDAFVVRTKFNLYTGHSSFTSEWGNAAFRASHDWQLSPEPFGGVRSTGGDIARTDRSDTIRRLAETHDRTSHGWEVRYASHRRSSDGLTFVSSFAAETPPEPGDTLVRVPFAWDVTAGPLRENRISGALRVEYESS